MAKKLKHKNLTAKTSITPKKRRAIETHQHKINNRLNKNKVTVTQNHSTKIEDPVNFNEVTPLENEDNNKDSYNEETPLLWVYEPSDLSEMSSDQIVNIWRNRKSLCGSKESAAEALAIYEVIIGATSEYKGWHRYIKRDEIIELDAPYLPDDINESYLNTLASTAISKSQVISSSEEDLKIAWSNRPNSFSSIEAACQALLMLRRKSGINKNDSWHDLLSHPEIKKLEEYLPNEIKKEHVSQNNSTTTKDSIDFDTRKKILKPRVIREGQQSFRASVMKNYYNCCCITKCRIEDILEAAHISPYSGQNSNRLDNSLCLRVDIHRLFDRFLISIEPTNYTVAIHESLKNDPTYMELDGVKLTRGKVHASKKLISQHYVEFLNRAPS